MRFFIRISMLIFIAAVLSACVSQTVHQQKLNENAYLQSVIKSLEGDYERLKADKAQLADRNDSLNQRVLEAIERNKLLQEDLMRARADLERVEKVLADRSAEAGTAMAEMRQEIDRLIEGNNLLRQQLEVELQAREARLAEVQSTYDELVGKLEQEIERGEVRISEAMGRGQREPTDTPRLGRRCRFPGRKRSSRHRAVSRLVGHRQRATYLSPRPGGHDGKALGAALRIVDHPARRACERSGAALLASAYHQAA